MRLTSTHFKVAGATVFWATVFHIGKYSVNLMSPQSVAAWRFVIAALILIPLVSLREGWPRAALRANFIPLAIMSLVGVFGFNVGLFFGLRQTSPVNGALILALNPATTVALSALIYRERISWRQGVGLLLGVAGVVVVVSRGSLHNLWALSFAPGDIWVFLGSLGWAVYSIIPRRHVRGLSTMQVTASTIGGGALLISLLALSTSSDFVQLPSPPLTLGLLCMGLFGSVLAYLWWNEGVQGLGAASTSVFINLVPIFTALIGIMLGQSVSAAQLVGAVLVIGGVLMTNSTSASTARGALPQQRVGCGLEAG